MGLDKNDLKSIKTLVEEVVEVTFDKKIDDLLYWLVMASPIAKSNW